MPRSGPGDRVLRIGGIDLRGLSYARSSYRTRGLLAAGGPLAVECERNGARFETEIGPVPVPFWWWPFPTWIANVLVGSFLLLRAPHWRLRRILFLAMQAWACFGVSLGPTHPLEKVLGSVVAFPLANAFTLWLYLAWAEKGRPGRFGRAFTWAFATSWLLVQALQVTLTFPTGTLPVRVVGVLPILGLPVFLGALVLTYRRSGPLERRQLRWILYTMFIAPVPVSTAYCIAVLVPEFDERFLALGWSLAGIIPLGYAVAIIGYGWLDIDRVDQR